MERATHFLKHGAKFGAATEDEYERLADAFMFGPMAFSTRQCLRPKRVDRLRFREVNRHFGVASIQPEFIRTFYPVTAAKVAKHGGPIAFFGYECGRVDL